MQVQSSNPCLHLCPQEFYSALNSAERKFKQFVVLIFSSIFQQKYLEEKGFTEGPNASPDIVLKEGQQLYMKFRGNIVCVSKKPVLNFVYNTNIRAVRDFRIDEKDSFAQKALQSYRGFVQVKKKYRWFIYYCLTYNKLRQLWCCQSVKIYNKTKRTKIKVFATSVPVGFRQFIKQNWYSNQSRFKSGSVSLFFKSCGIWCEYFHCVGSSGLVYFTITSVSWIQPVLGNVDNFSWSRKQQLVLGG